jgi:SPP1 family predicted phage head-tail adaptor
VLDLRVELFQPTSVPNNSGQVIKTWASAGTFYAERIILPQAGSETMPYDQMVSAGMVTWRLRFPNSVAAKWKLTYNNEDYDIVSVLPEGRRRFIIVKTRLRDNGTR